MPRRCDGRHPGYIAPCQKSYVRCEAALPIHIAALGQISHDTPGRAYCLRKQTEGKSRKEAVRCLKRRISDAVYQRLRADAGH